MYRRTLPVILSIAALALAACSSPEASAPTTEPAPVATQGASSPEPAEEGVDAKSGAILPGQYNGGRFEFRSVSGGVGEIEIPATAPADLAELDTADTAFLAVDVDNRKGADNINMYSVKLYDAAGVEYSYQREWSWMDYEVPDHDVSTDVYNSYLDDVSPGERKTVYMVGPAIPDEFVAVMVEPLGQMEEPVQATPAS